MGIWKEQPIISASGAVKELGISIPTARTALNILADLEIIESEDVNKKSKIYKFHEYMKALDCN